MPKKQFLFFTPNTPSNNTGAGTRSLLILNAFSEMGDIDLVVFNSITQSDRAILKNLCKNIYASEKVTLMPNSGIRKKLLNIVKYIFPFLMSNYELNNRIINLKSNSNNKLIFIKVYLRRYFLFFFNLRKPFPEMVYLFKKNIISSKNIIEKLLSEPGKTIIIDFNYYLPFLATEFDFTGHTVIGNSHNIEFELLMQASNNATNVYNRKWLKIQYLAMKRDEIKSLFLANKIFCCSEEDCLKYKPLNPSVNISVIPNAVDTNYFYPQNIQHVEHSLLFTGTMNYSPNIEAVNWFVTEVFPLLKKRYPNVQFIIAGKNANSLNIKNEGITIISDPEDIRPYFGRCAICVVPLLQGSGTRLKILEAAAMQKPIISTTLGAEGIRGLDPSNILIANTVVEFYDGISKLFDDKTLQLKIAKNAYDLITRNYSWVKIISEIKNQYSKYFNLLVSENESN